MVTPALSPQAHDDLTSRICAPEVCDAFHDLVAGLADMGRFDLRPNIGGRKKALQVSSGRVSYFAVVANNHWLLWYFRWPGFRDGVFDWPGLHAAFPDLQRSGATRPDRLEAVLRLRTPAEADAVLRYVRAARC
jgi:hypothetical protein